MRGAGGCIFFASPTKSVRNQPIFWLRDVLADCVILRSIESAASHVQFEPSRWPGKSYVYRGEVDTAMLIVTDDIEYRVFLEGSELPVSGAPLAIILPPDSHFHARIAAAERFASLVADPAVSLGRPPKAPTPSFETISRRMFMLWALDLEFDGMRLIDMAATMLGSHALAGDAWKTSDLRSEVRRLRVGGRALMNGGYLNLLKPRKRQFTSSR